MKQHIKIEKDASTGVVFIMHVVSADTNKETHGDMVNAVNEYVTKYDTKGAHLYIVYQEHFKQQRLLLTVMSNVAREVQGEVIS